MSSLKSAGVVITGVGVVSPFGTGADKLWQALTTSMSGVGPLPVSTLRNIQPSSAEVKDFEATDFMDRKDARRLDRFIRCT